MISRLQPSATAASGTPPRRSGALTLSPDSDTWPMARPQLPPDFTEFLKLCLDHEVRFMVIGGIAVVYHGHPRLTLDLDLWIEPTAENGERVVTVLEAFGFRSPGVAASDFENPRQILRLGLAPTVIEIFSSIPGVEFTECYARRVGGRFGRLTVPFLSLPDLKTAKRASGRPKDLQDLEELPPD